MEKSRTTIWLSGVFLCAVVLMTAQHGWAQIGTIVTPPGPSIRGGLFAGSTTVTGTTAPDLIFLYYRSCFEIFTCTPGNCTLGSGTQIGGPVCPNALGAFSAPLTTPLVGNEFAFAFDTCSDLMGPIFRVPAVAPNPAPAMSPPMIGVLAAILALIGLFGLRVQRGL